MTSGETLLGLLVKQGAHGATVRDLAGQMHGARTEKIASLTALPVSLMPEGLLAGLDDAALRDFFAYLMKP